MTATDDTLRLCFHEAAHLVVAHLLRVGITRATVVPAPDGRRGVVEYQRPRSAMDELIVALAGGLSERAPGEPPPAGDDRAAAEACLRKMRQTWGGPAHVEAEELAAILLNRNTHAWGQLAAALGVRGTMTGEQVHDFLAALNVA